MKKSDRLEAFVRDLPNEVPHGLVLHPCYAGYFTCFNAGQYYEAHDVLEHLWLQGKTSDSDFYKGLIQLAGAFVHLRKQFLRPDHPTDGRRLGPAFRLFALAERNLERYGPRHLHLDVAGAAAMCRAYAGAIEEAGFRVNPWSPERMPVLEPGLDG